MKHIQQGALKSAQQVRREEKLPKDGRNATNDLKILENVFRDALDPDIPSYDVNSTQGTDFDEWTYTEGLEAFMAFTQSVEINARLALEAAEWDGEIEVDHVEEIRANLRDKWSLKGSAGVSVGEKVFFPPGNNLGWLINTDNVLRAFCTDKTWRLKPHPITSDDDVRQAKLSFGITRLYDRQCSGMDVLRACECVGYTTASEMGLIGMILGKETVDFSKFEFEGCGRYHSLYLAVRESRLDPKVILNRLFNCPWSGFEPLHTTSIETAKENFLRYKERTLELSRLHAPLTRRAVVPPRKMQ